jgi:hypothetical protein
VGLALNIAALGGVLVPVLSSLDVRLLATLFTAPSMAILLIMSIKVKVEVKMS